MGTIKIEIPGKVDRTFHVDSNGSAEIAFKEIKSLLEKGPKRPRVSRAKDRSANERLARARRHLKSIEKCEAAARPCISPMKCGEAG